MKEKKIAVGAMVCLVVLALVITIVVLVLKQGNTTTTTPEAPTTGTENKVEEKKEENKNTTTNNAVDLSNSYKVPGKKIVINVPNWQEMEKGFTELYILHGLKYVAVTAETTSVVTTVEEAHTKAFEKFKQNIQNYSYVNSLTVKTSSKETINGIEVYKYEGTLNCALDYSNRDNSYDAYVIGYSFIMDGVPCNITGSVIAEDGKIYQKNGEQVTVNYEEEVSEMKSTVEAMIKTLRSER